MANATINDRPITDRQRRRLHDSLAIEHAPRILDLLTRFDAPPSVMAGHLLGQPSTLGYYRRAEPEQADT
jgi:hypothetical protein